MSLKKLFGKISSKKAVGIVIATGSGALLVVDAFRLAHGDVSVFGGTSFAAAFAAHAGLISTGLGLIPRKQTPHKTVVIQEFNQPRPLNHQIAA